MAYYRITYDGYIEGEYDSKEEAIKDMIDAMKFDIEDNDCFNVEKFEELGDF